MKVVLYVITFILALASCILLSPFVLILPMKWSFRGDEDVLKGKWKIFFYLPGVIGYPVYFFKDKIDKKIELKRELQKCENENNTYYRYSDGREVIEMGCDDK